MGFQVDVHGNNVEAALARLKKMTKDLRDSEKAHEYYKKPSEKKREAEAKRKRKNRSNRNKFRNHDEDDD